MGKKKDDNYYKKQLEELKAEKRDLCGSISSNSYGELNNQGDFKTNQEVKKVKEEIKKKRRAIKRSQKQEWKKEIDEEVDKWTK